jgi:hypothetical protein
MSRSYLSDRVAWDGLAHRLPLYHRWFCEREYGPGDDGGDGDDRNARAQSLLPRNDDHVDAGGDTHDAPRVRYDDPWNNMPSGLPEAGRNILPADHPVRARTCAPELDVGSGLHPRKGWGTDKGKVVPAVVRDDIPRTR